MICKYRKRPVIVEAVQWDGTNNEEVLKLCPKAFILHNNLIAYMRIPTLEGVMYALVGDYIIKGIKGEFYPCKSDIFKETYEEVNDEL